MSKSMNAMLTFQRGILSRLGLARIDLARTSLSAEIMSNWMPRILGSMSLRPGLQYTGATKSNNKSRSLPFVASITDTARVEVTEGVLRIWVDDSLVTRGTVTAAVTNGSFTSDVTGWTDSDEGGATSAWLTGGYLALLGNGTNAAIRDQQVTVNEVSTEHALRITIARGPVVLRVGSTSGGDEYLEERTLGTGVYSFAFTPTGNFHIRLFSRENYTVLVDSVAVESAGVLEFSVPWQEDDLTLIRRVQSGDVIYTACRGFQQRVVSRHGAGSWSVALYEPTDGPFRPINATPVTITPSALSGDITLTASKSLFKTGHVGALWRMDSTGQTVTDSFSAQNDFSSEIRVTGIGGQRSFGIQITGTFVATLTLQYSVAEPGNWVDVTTYTAPTSTSYADDLDNQIIYYRIGIKTGNYTSGTAAITLSLTSGSITGVARVTAYTSPTVVSAVVLRAFGATTASSDWWEGRWSDHRGWPSAVSLHEGRVWMGGNDKILGTISDDFTGYDDGFEGDAGPISRSIGEGPVDNINWMMSLGRLIIGTESSSANIEPVRMESNSILSARSNSFDEPLTPTNFNLKYANTTGIYVDQSGTRLMSVGYDLQANDYLSSDLFMLAPDIAEDGITALGIQKNPDPRVHAPIADGTAIVLVYDKLEDVRGLVKVETDGIIEDVCVLPRVGEDAVYLTVKRTINGSTVRYHEKMARLSECRGGTLNRQADSFVVYSGAATTTITGLSHLEGQDVVAWGNGKDLGTYTVSAGQIAGLTSVATGESEAVTSAVIGLSYEALWKSGKQSIANALGVPLNQDKRIDSIGLILADTHKDGLYYGPDFDNLDPLPQEEDGETVEDDTVHEAYDKPMITFPGEWTTDARFCLKAVAPRPCTVLSCVVSMTF
jgi:hypothetical protein